MHAIRSSVRSRPRTAAAPIYRRLLQPFGQRVLLTILTRTLTRQLSEGEFGCLIGRVPIASINAPEVRWPFTVNATGDRIVKATGPADTTIHADSSALLLAAARRVMCIGIGLEIARMDTIVQRDHDILFDFMVTEAGIGQRVDGWLVALDAADVQAAVSQRLR